MRHILSRVVRGAPPENEPYVQLLVGFSEAPVTDRRKLIASVQGFPLTWWCVWTCILVTLSLGVISAWSQSTRFVSPIFDGAKASLAWAPGDPMMLWGWIFVVAAALLTAATLFSSTLVWVLLRVNGTFYAVHGALVAAGAMASGETASYSGVPMCLFVMAIHFETAYSIRMILRYRFPKEKA